MTFIAWLGGVFHCMLCSKCKNGRFRLLHIYRGRRPGRKWELEGVGCRKEYVVKMRKREFKKYRETSF